MVNKDKIKEAVTLLLEGIGEDIHREGLKDTPDRIARMRKTMRSFWKRISYFIPCANII